MSLVVAVTGLDQIQRLVDPAAFNRALDSAIERAAEAIRDDTKRLPPVSAKRTGFEQPGIPVDTGRMRQSIQKRKIALFGAEIYADTKYSKFVHDGTGRMPARPFFQWQLENFGGKERIAGIVSSTLKQLFG